MLLDDMLVVDVWLVSHAKMWHGFHSFSAFPRSHTLPDTKHHGDMRYGSHRQHAVSQ